MAISTREPGGSEESPIRIISTPELIALNFQAVREGRNRSIAVGTLNDLPLGQSNLVVVHFAIDEGVRCEILIDEHGHTVWLDLSYRAFNRLDSLPISA